MLQRILCRGNLFANKLSATPVSLMIICDTQHVCGLCDVWSLVVNLTVCVRLWMSVCEAVNVEIYTLKDNKVKEHHKKNRHLSYNWQTLSRCEFQWSRITGLLSNKSNNNPVLKQILWLTNHADRYLRVSFLRPHHYHVHPPPGRSRSAERPHRLPGAGRVEVLRLPAPPERQAGSRLQSHPHQEGTYPHGPPSTCATSNSHVHSLAALLRLTSAGGNAHKTALEMLSNNTSDAAILISLTSPTNLIHLIHLPWFFTLLQDKTEIVKHLEERVWMNSLADIQACHFFIQLHQVEVIFGGCGAATLAGCFQMRGLRRSQGERKTLWECALWPTLQ